MQFYLTTRMLKVKTLNAYTRVKIQPPWPCELWLAAPPTSGRHGLRHFRRAHSLRHAQWGCARLTFAGEVGANRGPRLRESEVYGSLQMRSRL